MSFILTTFPDGNALKQLIEIFYLCVPEGNLVFTPAGIQFTEQSPQRDIILSATIPIYNLITLHFPNLSFNMGIDLKSFRQLTKSILKKDKVQFEVLTPTSDLQIRQSSKSTTFYYKFFHNISLLDPHLIPEFKTEENHPYLTAILLSEFSKTCQDLSKSEWTEFKFYTNRLKLQGIHDFQPDRAVDFIRDEEAPEELLGQVDVSSYNMKALAKLANLAPTATVKLYYENAVLKILVPIAYLGTLEVYLFHLINKY